MKPKRISLGILNVATFPHDGKRATYHALFMDLAKQDKFIKVRGDEFAYITSCVPVVEGDVESDLTGEIHKFLEIDRKGWENLQSRKTASAKDLAQIVIPDHLKPNSERFRYIFFTREHKLVFQMKGEKRTISHKKIETLLNELLKGESIVKKYPLVNVTIETEPHALDQIWKLSKLLTLTIEVNRPNPDGFGADAERWVAHLLQAQGASRQIIKLNAAPNESLKPNEENTKLAEAASSNGKVQATGRDERNKAVNIDTSEHPATQEYYYDPSLKCGFLDQLIAAAKTLVRRLHKEKQHDPPARNS